MFPVVPALPAKDHLSPPLLTMKVPVRTRSQWYAITNRSATTSQIASQLAVLGGNFAALDAGRRGRNGASGVLVLVGQARHPELELANGVEMVADEGSHPRAVAGGLTHRETVFITASSTLLRYCSCFGRCIARVGHATEQVLEELQRVRNGLVGLVDAPPGVHDASPLRGIISSPDAGVDGRQRCLEPPLLLDDPIQRGGGGGAVQTVQPRGDRGGPALVQVPHPRDDGARPLPRRLVQDITYADKVQLPARARRDFVMHAPFEVRIGGDGDYALDLDGSSAWGWHSMNCTPSGMQGAIWVMFTQTLICNDKVNDGAYFAVETNFPEGSVANLGEAEGSTGIAWAFLQPAFTGYPRTLSRALQSRGFIEEVIGAYSVSGNVIQGGGIDQYGNSVGDHELRDRGAGHGGQVRARRHRHLRGDVQPRGRRRRRRDVGADLPDDLPLAADQAEHRRPRPPSRRLELRVAAHDLEHALLGAAEPRHDPPFHLAGDLRRLPRLGRLRAQHPRQQPARARRRAARPTRSPTAPSRTRRCWRSMASASCKLDNFTMLRAVHRPATSTTR